MQSIDPIPAKSVVQVYFPARGLKLAYFNDRFDLHVGDIVYVDGKLEGLRGQVVEVNYNFKIKLSEYKRVIGKADVQIAGTLHLSGDYLLAFSPEIIPYQKVLSWYKALRAPDEEYLTGSDETAFDLKDLEDLETMGIDGAVAQRGYDYYLHHNLRYLCLDGRQGQAIVEGTRVYEVEFQYDDGEISRLVCDCFCSAACKHEFAALLQLRELLKEIETHHAGQMNGYFAAISKAELFRFTIANRAEGTLTLGTKADSAQRMEILF